MRSTMEILQAARRAKASLSLLTTQKKNEALAAMAAALVAASDDILAAKTSFSRSFILPASITAASSVSSQMM